MITVTFVFGNYSFDVCIDKRQKISSVYVELSKKGLRLNRNPDFYKSLINDCLVSAYCTFEEEGIYTGDKLIAIINN